MLSKTGIRQMVMGYANRGWPVLPLNRVTGEIKTAQDVKESKKPLVAHGFKDASTDLVVVTQWLRQWPTTANWGVRCGEVSGITVLDLDVYKPQAQAAWDMLRDMHPEPLPDTPMMRSGQGGISYFFRYNPRAKSGTNRLAEGIDFKNDESYCVVPPSITLRPYEWEISPDDVELAEAPAWIFNGVVLETMPKRVQVLKPETLPMPVLDQFLGSRSGGRPELKPGPEPVRESVLMSEHKRLRDLKVAAKCLSLLSPSRADDYLMWLEVGMALHALGPEGFSLWDTWSRVSPKWAPSACDQKWRTFSAERTSASAVGIGSLVEWAKVDSGEDTIDETTDRAMTSLGNAQRFLNTYGQDALYSVRQGQWLLWDGTRWRMDELNSVYHRAIRVVRSIFKEASEEQDADRAKALGKWGIRSQDRNEVDKMLYQAGRQVGVLLDDMDADAWILNCQNGVLDLRTGRLRPHAKIDYITKVAPVAYDENARCPKWMTFLLRVMADRPDLVNFLQRSIGYSLSGDVSEQCFFIMFGSGANGKSVALESVMGMLGAYAVTTPTESLMLRRFDGGIPNDIARMKGARVVAANEVEHGRRLAESRIKAMTGGDTMIARFLHREFFEFSMQAKIWLRANHKPIITGTDPAIWRRVKLVPFDVAIPERERNQHLKEELVDEWPGILAWAVEGCLMWQGDGLAEPQEVTDATSAYRSEMDMVGLFLDERTEQGGWVSSNLLYKAYAAWCDASGERAVSGKAFSMSLTERGYEKHRHSDGVRVLGLSLQLPRPTAEPSGGGVG